MNEHDLRFARLCWATLMRLGAVQEVAMSDPADGVYLVPWVLGEYPATPRTDDRLWQVIPDIEP